MSRRVCEVLRTEDADEANEEQRLRMADGERIIAHWRDDAIVLYRFEGMTEPEINAYIDRQW